MTDSEKLQEKHISNLFDNVTVTAEIICGKCDKEDTVQSLDDYDAAKYFYEEGWYSNGTVVYCPECNTTRLKKIQNIKNKQPKRGKE